MGAKLLVLSLWHSVNKKRIPKYTRTLETGLPTYPPSHLLPPGGSKEHIMSFFPAPPTIKALNIYWRKEFHSGVGVKSSAIHIF